MKKILLCLSILTCLGATAQKKDSSTLSQVKQLTTVEIKSKRPFLEQQADKMVINIAADQLASGGNMLEALQRAPGVSVINDETITMSGKAGVNVLIDGRPTQLTGKDLAAYLKSLPATLADKIEIITNPSAKYDAQGNAGIINIRFKKNTIKGINGSITASYMARSHYQSDVSGNINYRRNKVNLFANAAFSEALQYTSGNIHRYVSSNGISKTFENSTTDQDASHRYNITTGADLYLDKKNTLGFIIKTSNDVNPMYTPGTTLISTANKVDSSLLTANDNHDASRRTNANINYRYADTLGNTLSIDADAVHFTNPQSGLVTASLLNGQGRQYDSTATSQTVNNRINIYGLKADYTKEIKKHHAKLEAGVKYNSTNTRNNLFAASLRNGSMQPDSGRSNIFTYTEKVAAAYVTFSQSINKWEYQAGLRIEHTQAAGNSTDLHNTAIHGPDTAYTNLFPAVFVQYSFNQDNRLRLSYTRRINRPTYQDLNPFEYQYDNYSSYTGNPYLQPEFSSNIEASYTFKNAYTASVSYSNTQSYFQSISTQTGEKIQSTVFNIGNMRRADLTLSAGTSIAKWWYSYNTLTPAYQAYSGSIPAGTISNSSLSVHWYTSQQFTLPHSYSLQLSSWGNLATHDALYRTKWLGSIDLGGGKTIKKLSIKLAVLDIFNTQRWSQLANFGNIVYDYNRKWESRGVRLRLTYKFGRTSFTQRERVVGAESELGRIK